MQKVVEKNLSVKEPLVVLPLSEWNAIEEELEELEEAVRFRSAFEESRNEKMISLEDWAKKHGLKMVS